MSPPKLAWIAVAALLAAAGPGVADEEVRTGRVVGVFDGDTIEVLAGGREMKVRLAEIDTPERGQPYWKRAKYELSRLVFDREVRVVAVDHDRHGRLVGRVFAGGRDASAEMVRGGHAWVYRRYARDATLYALEDEARRARRGLWALPEAQRTPPWEWRHAAPSRAPPVARSAPRADSGRGGIVGNRRSRIYHWPGCPGYDDVSASNRVPFPSRAAAESAGYRAARNCP